MSSSYAVDHCALLWKYVTKVENLVEGGGGGTQTLVAVIVNVFLRDSIVT